MKNRWNRGSVTMETAMVLPVVIVINLLLVTFLIRIYDRNVMQVAACQSAMQAYYGQWNSNAETEKICFEKAGEVVSGNLVGTKKPKVTVSAGRFKVRVALKAESALDDIGLFGLDFKDLLPEAFAEWETDRFSATELIRNIRRAEAIKKWGEEIINTKKGEENDRSGIQERTGPQLPDSQGGG